MERFFLGFGMFLRILNEKFMIQVWPMVAKASREIIKGFWRKLQGNEKKERKKGSEY